MFSISAEPRGGNLAVDLWSAAEATPDRAAVVDRLQATSYAALRARAAACARALDAAGAHPAHRVGILLSRGADAVAAYYATLAVGAVPVVINDNLHPRQIGHLLAQSGPATS